MPQVYSRLRKFLRDDDGPTAVEYAVMLAMIVLVCFASIRLIGTNSSPHFERVAQSLGS